LVVEVARPYTMPADGPDLFWNFVLSPAVSEPRYVRAVEVRPGNPQAVHHATLLVDRAHSGRQQETAPGAGFPGMDLDIETETFDPDSHFLFWKPGNEPYVEPKGMAWRLNPGDDLVLNVHFHATGKVERVRPSVGIYFTDEPPTKSPILLQLEQDRALNIPPGDRDFLVADDFRLPADVDVIAVYPHAHYLGTLLEGYATLPDGSREWLIRIPQWDLNWQAVYRYEKPVFLPKGTVLSMRFHYDNSAQNPRNPNSPPRRVVAGNQSTDEMGHLWLQVLPHGDGDLRALLQEALMRHRLERDPENFGAHFTLGTLLLSRKESASAIVHFQAALRSRPAQPMALNDLGAALEAEGRLDQAVLYFHKALQLRPDYVTARYNLAIALAALGKLEEAATELRNVLAAAPGDSAARDHLIAVLIQISNAAIAREDLEAAGGAYRELISLRPGDAGLRNNYGILLARSGNLLAAAGQWEAALKLNPNHAAARRNLEMVRRQLARH
jgi:Flp pilus assembly protein TadD